MDNAPLLNNQFDIARNEASHERHQQEQFLIKGEEAQIAAGTLDEEDATRHVNKSRIGNQSGGNNGKDKKSDIAFYAMLEQSRLQLEELKTQIEKLRVQLDELEANMGVKYGERFADNLAADLLDKATCAQLMQIKDEDARRAATAKAINEGIKNSTIDPADAYQNSDYREWLETHDQKDMLTREKEAILNNEHQSRDNSLALTSDKNGNSDLDALFSNKL